MASINEIINHDGKKRAGDHVPDQFRGMLETRLLIVGSDI